MNLRIHWALALVTIVAVSAGCGRGPAAAGASADGQKADAGGEAKLAVKNEPGPVTMGEVTRFEQMGHYSDSRMDGYVFYIKNPTMKDIESFCAEKQQELAKKGKSLKIYFFDNRDKVPDISGGFEIERTSDDYCVADYSYNGQIGLFEITAHKKMQ